MLYRGFLKAFIALALIITSCLTPASAQWMFEKKPTAKSSAFEVASSVPSDVLFVTGFQLKNQIDLKGLVAEIRTAAKKSKGANQEFVGIEKHLGMPISEWVGLFNGRGFLALMEPKGIAPSDSWILALQLEKPTEARQWFKSRYFAKKKPIVVRGFEVYDFDGTEFGFGKGWVFLTRTRLATEALTATLSGAPDSLAADATFRKAQESLTGGQSGMFFYLDGDAVRSTAYSAVELPAEHPASESLGFWDFAVLSLDLAKEEADGFLGYVEREGKVSTALRRPGRISAGLVDLLPAGLSTVWAGDAGWAFHLTKALGDEIPEVGMLLGFVNSALSEFGDFDAAFTGTMVSGSNALDVIAQFVQYDFILARRRGELVGCENNLKNIGTALEMYGSDNAGKYPESLAAMAPNYLGTVPKCPTDAAKPYSYTRSAEGEASYLVSCTGHQHPMLKPGSPKYSSSEGILQEYDETASSAPVMNAAMEEPSLAVVLPVDDVAATHNLMLNAVESNEEKPVDLCGQNLLSLSSAATSYTYDHEGAYPKSISILVPEYLEEIPKCPVAERDTYSGSYEVVGDNTGVKLFCKGHNHPELESDKPLYDTTSDEGIETGPVASLAKKKAPPVPENGATAEYEVNRGPKGALDSGNKVLRLAYGPKGHELLKAPPGKLSENALVAESLKWGNDTAIYLDYIDLGPLYSASLEALEKASGAGSEEAAVTLDILKAIRARVKGLEGSSCLRVTDKGLHFRSRGVGSSQLMGGLVVGTAAVGVPNFAKAKSQGQLTACKSNLKNIGTALEMWSTDNNGNYPESMAPLAPDYLRYIPICPAAEADTYSATYRLIKSEKHGYTYYEVYCKGHHHERAGVEADYPRYNGESGLIERP